MNENNLSNGPSIALIEKLSQKHPTLHSLIESFCVDGADKNLNLVEEIEVFFNDSNTCGMKFFNYGLLQGIIKLNLLSSGATQVETGCYLNGKYETNLMVFDAKGSITTLVDSSAVQKQTATIYFSTCPFVNFMYNHLAVEYNSSSQNTSCTQRVHTFELILRQLAKTRVKMFSFNLGANDPAYAKIFSNLLVIEKDPILKWSERQVIIDQAYTEMELIKTTKVRAHKSFNFKIAFKLKAAKVKNFIQRLKRRPVNNFGGIFYRHTFGVLFWFFGTIRKNLGYSIALAVYGPFTYYFITMPMNPHAMTAVGKLRNAVIDSQTVVVNYVKNFISPSKSELAFNDTVSTIQSAARITNVTPSINVEPTSTNQSANAQANILSNILGISELTQGTPEAYTLSLDSSKNKYLPTYLNMLLSIDVPQVDTQTWNERMSNYKDMNIAYEENLEYASRMGRLEQLETQYNFPMVAETAWEEMDRYINQVFKFRQNNPNISAKMKQFLFNEVNRTQQLQLYVWDRMNRFIQDQPYVMLDEDKEQKRNDYYVGRAFVFMHEMTTTLSYRYQNLKKPANYDKIEKLAELYKANRKETGNIIKNLKMNSDLFKQKDHNDSKELRAQMKRQWEILFLQNAKAEEGSNNGLNLYIWSVRNALWAMQSFYSAKRRDLEILGENDLAGNINNNGYELSKIDMLYETLYHNMMVEYIGVREEMSKRLGRDIEYIQRQTVMNNLKESIVDRAKLRNQMTSTADVQAQAQL
jgi:hypothetical protein